MKQRIRLTESQLHQVIKESVKRVLKEMDGDGEPFYVAADTESEYFTDENEAYEYAKKVALKSMREDPENWEPIHLMDNQKWQSLVIFDEKGIHDLTNGTFMPW